VAALAFVSVPLLTSQPSSGERLAIVQNRQKINEDRILDLEHRITFMEQAQKPQDIAMATLAVRIEDLSKVNGWIVYLLSGMFALVIGKGGWDVINANRIGVRADRLQAAVDKQAK
jgi:hypothetical protein